jgi:hypothetical protein
MATLAALAPQEREASDIRIFGNRAFCSDRMALLCGPLISASD